MILEGSSQLNNSVIPCFHTELLSLPECAVICSNLPEQPVLGQGREGKSLELEDAWWEAGQGLPPWTKRKFPWLDEGSKTRSNAWFEAHPAFGRTGPELPFELIPSHLVCPDQLLSSNTHHGPAKTQEHPSPVTL